MAAEHVVVDIGCGPGADLGCLTDKVGPTGRRNHAE
jgi:hypothetical protein